MDALSHDIRAVSPLDPVLEPLLETHLRLMRASSPACSVHAMDAGALADAGVAFFAVFEAGAPVAIGGLKPVGPGHGEINSMHVIEAARGRGLARRVLARLLEEARARGHSRVSLETGSQDVFAPARAFHAREGFDLCPPFEGYRPDPASVFMTRPL